MEYTNFDLIVEPSVDNKWRITAHSPVAGEAREVVRFPLDEEQLRRQLNVLEEALRSGGQVRHFEPDDAAADLDGDPKAFASQLFTFLFHGQIGQRLAVHQDQCEREKKGTRLRLKIQDGGLAALPWEFLCDARLGNYLALSKKTPIVRYIELPRSLQPISVEPPLRVLGMVASPSNLVRLDVEKEKARIEEATQLLRKQGLLELTWLDGQDRRALQRALRRGAWHVFHFIGHGDFDKEADEGYLALVDEDSGRSKSLSADHLSLLLADHTELRVVILNACEGGQGGRDVFSSTAATLIRKGVPTVIAMQHKITDKAAIEFARSFYESLADGLAIEAAVSETRKSMSLANPNSLEWGTPVLFTHAPDGVLFEVNKAAAQQARITVNTAGGSTVDYLRQKQNQPQPVPPTEHIEKVNPTSAAPDQMPAERPSIQEWVDVLQKTDMRKPHVRNAIVDQLPSHIRQVIDRYPTERDDIWSIAQTCHNYQDGLRLLVEAIEWREGTSKPVQKLKQLL